MTPLKIPRSDVQVSAEWRSFPTSWLAAPGPRLRTALLVGWCTALPVVALAAPGAAGAGAEAERRAACDAPTHAQVLVPEGQPLKDARGHWLDAARLQWPGLAAADASAGRWVLAASATGALRTVAGEPLAGAAQVLTLQADATPLPGALAERFRHLAAGARWRVPGGEAAALEALWSGDTRLVQLDAADRVLRATRLQLPGALDDRYAAAAEDPRPLGVHITRPTRPGQPAAATTWRLWAPTARAVHLCLYPGAQARSDRLVPLRPDPATGTWHARLPGDLGRDGRRFSTYLVDVWVPGTGLVRQRVTDPYAVSLNADSKRTWVGRLDDPRTQPPGWARAPRPKPIGPSTDLALYELHVRDFSRDDATVPAAERGKYTAFARRDSDGMRHLRALARAGMTDVHLLPVFDLATVPERGCVSPVVPAAAPDSPAQQAAVMAVARQDCFNWGYDPLHFNAPEGSFATDADDAPGRLRDFRRMVMALNAIGLRVGKDVVYNHMSASGQHPQSVLDRIVPGYYHRLNAEGVVERSTCCDNTATEHRMMGRLMRDSVRLWATEHRIDSFRFDLMGHQPRDEMLRLKAELARDHGRPIHLIGEGWNFGEVADGARFVQASQLSLGGSGIATFSDRARDALRGGGVGDPPEQVIKRQGVLNGLGLAPNEAVQADLAALAAQGAQMAQLAASMDLVRLGLAGTLRGYAFENADGVVRRGDAMRYSGQIAGYAEQPTEVVNYVENHDNHTLWDVNAFKLPLATTAAERARVQVLGIALTALSQGVPYFHAGIELLRSKSMDGNSYDSGDWFNRMDFSGRTNHFGTGLPPEGDNKAMWPLIAPRLPLPQMQPAPADIAFARQATADWLQVRTSSRAFRLATAEAVQQRLRMRNTGPAQVPGLLAAELDARGLEGGGFARLLVLVNVAPGAQTLALPEQAGQPGQRWRLHPVLVRPEAADARARDEARFDAAAGRFTVPGRTALVYVQD